MVVFYQQNIQKHFWKHSLHNMAEVIVVMANIDLEGRKQPTWIQALFLE